MCIPGAYFSERGGFLVIILGKRENANLSYILFELFICEDVVVYTCWSECTGCNKFFDI